MTWEIFLGIAALVAFAISVGTPILKLNTNIVKLNSTIEALRESVNRIDKLNEEEHKELWKHNEEQDESMTKLTGRVDKLDKDFEIAKALHPELLPAKSK